MQITLKGRIAEKIAGDLKDIDIGITRGDGRRTRSGYRSGSVEDAQIDLSSLTRHEVERLGAVLDTSGVQGAKVAAADIRKYLAASEEGVGTMTARTVRQAAWMLEHYIAALPHHMVFNPDRYGGGSYSAHYVDDVQYHPEHRAGDQFIPEHVTISMIHIEDDSRRGEEVKVEKDEVLRRSAEEILAAVDLVPENDTLMERLRDETERYYIVRERIGHKYIGGGVGIVDLDNAAATHGWGSSRVRIDSFGIATPLVVDVLHETEEDRRYRKQDARVNLYRWHEWNLRFFSPSEDVLVREMEADEDTEFESDVQVPVHPLVPCFDLRRHLRMRVHVNNLTEYAYRREVAEGLILPERDWALVQLLVEQSSNTFNDVISGKGQSMNVLAGGPPGTGKTLTAEVLAEFMERPLYSVQCSQLGLRPEELEKNLGVILQRANRWNAVLLLDEADVYIRRRDADLNHNAIVGVFLRMLEYASCVLFMTTNMLDTVDDAIASRCIVAVHYDVPEPEAQAAIWRSLAGLNGLTLMPETIACFVAAHPRITGRDVKNLLKLGALLAARRGSANVALVDLEFALQYKPTADVAAVPLRDVPSNDGAEQVEEDVFDLVGRPLEDEDR